MERPCDVQDIGETVSLLGFEFDGNERRGLTARCRKREGTELIVAAWELTGPPDSPVARYLVAYRRNRWIDTTILDELSRIDCVRTASSFSASWKNAARRS